MTRPRYALFDNIIETEALASGVPYLVTAPLSAKNAESDPKQCLPVAYSLKAPTTMRDFTASGSIFLVLGLFT
ncbi:MAG: hypothetical protein PHV93_01415 [Candidatus Pacebacteria bacterium]|nr:hypothetical protein [Candidatus Paceibacterota bacterium]